MYNCVLRLLFLAVLCAVFAYGKPCNGWAKYTLTLKGEWTRQTHSDFPPNPHFSPTVGCSHNASYVMWKSGIKATVGVKSVAETGSTSAIDSEMDNQIGAKNAYKKNKGRVIFGGTNSDSIPNIEVRRDYPLVSFISMIAPSPDWFIGVHNLSLCNTTTGKWKDREVKDLFPYDAGTDSGPRFKSPDAKTDPPEDIHLLTNKIEGSLKGNLTVKKFATFTFVKTSENNIQMNSPTGAAPTRTANTQ